MVLSKTPVGWTRKQVLRKSGTTKGRIDIYYYSPNGKIFRSKNQVSDYIKTNNICLNIDVFDFKTVIPKSISPKKQQQSHELLENTPEMDNQPELLRQLNFNTSTPKNSFKCIVNSNGDLDSELTEKEEVYCSVNEDNFQELSKSLAKASEDLKQLKFENKKQNCHY